MAIVPEEPHHALCCAISVAVAPGMPTHWKHHPIVPTNILYLYAYVLLLLLELYIILPVPACSMGEAVKGEEAFTGSMPWRGGGGIPYACYFI